MNKKTFSILVGILASLCFGTFAFAAESQFSSLNDPIVGGDWKVNLEINTPVQNINAVAGKIIFPSDLLQFVGASDAGSVVNLWVEKPVVVDGKVEFSGITPGGYQGTSGKIFELDFKVLKAGSGKIELVNTESLLGDGKGTATEWKTSNLSFRAKTGDVQDQKNTDKTPPEPFEIQIGRSEYLFNNQWFAAFQSEDKDSGVAYYEIQETENGIDDNAWKKADSPVQLTDQTLKKHIFVRATDRQGNVRVAEYKSGSKATSAVFDKYPIWGIILVVILAFGFYLWRKKRGKAI